jgi:hypothetical protein
MAMIRQAYSIELTAPKDGDVYLAGESIEIQATVKRLGGAEGKSEQLGPPSYSAKGGSAVVSQGGSATGKTKAGPATLAVGNDQAEVTLLAEFRGAKKSITVKVVKPVVAKLELVDNGGNVFNLFDHETNAEAPPAWEFDAAGKVVKGHAAAVKFGTKLKAKLTLGMAEKPTKAPKLNVAIRGPLGPAAAPGQKAPAGTAGGKIVFALPSDKQSTGVDWNGDTTATFDLETAESLPFYVAAHDWTLDVRAGPKGDVFATGVDPKSCALSQQVHGVKVFAVWGKPAVGEGKIQDPGTEPLAKSHYDTFHVGHATRWAQGGWNLLLEGAGSIPRLVQGRMRHYAWPGDYEGKDGKPANTHPRPKNADKLSGDGLADATPAAQPSIADYRCARCKGQHITKPGAGGAAGCWDCRKPHETAFIRWANGRYIHDTGSGPACGFSFGDGLSYDPKSANVQYSAGSMVFGGSIMATATAPKDWKPIEWCPACHWVMVYLEVQCAACKQWVSDKEFLTGKHQCEAGGGEPTAEGNEPSGKNWGFGVLDNPDNPGGKPHQHASAMAAALNALGVKATVNYLRRPGGAVNFKEHDPVTRGSACYDPARDWGAPLAAFVAVASDSSRDNDFGGAKVREAEAVVFDAPVRGGPRTTRSSPATRERSRSATSSSPRSAAAATRSAAWARRRRRPSSSATPARRRTSPSPAAGR